MHVLADGYFWDYVHLCTDPSQVTWEISRAQCEQLDGLWLRGSDRCQPTRRDCFAWAAFWRGGLAYYGGLLAAGLFGITFLKREGFPVRRGLDIASMSICLGLFFGRMGCFLAGCCFGVHTDHAFGLSFPAYSPASESQWRAGLLSAAHLPSLPVHPTQLYEALGCLTLAAYLMLWLRPRKRFDGQLMLVFVGLYALMRFVLEYYRADDRGEILGLSSSQALGLPALLLVAFLWSRWTSKRD
jgi:phosphatidylglycerol:prolipoprotein diacylglycerol transferase